MTEFHLIRDSLNEIHKDIREIRADVNTLMTFKWKIVGGTVVASLILTGLINLVAFVIRN